jgi:hypothetical protein
MDGNSARSGRGSRGGEQWEGRGGASAPVDWVGDERKLGVSNRFSSRFLLRRLHLSAR